MRLSIIVPVYNVEKYIKNTLESIYYQKVDESLFEVIVVNDGTPDNSMKIINEFSKEHNNLTIINKINGGLSSARNTGVKNASGDYLWFVDSDDQILNNSIDTILTYLEELEVDVLFFGYKSVDEKTGLEKNILPIYRKSGYKYYNQITSGYNLCNKVEPWLSQKIIINRYFFIKNGLWFNESIIHEDVEQGVRLFCEAYKCYCCKDIIYRYLLRESGSITTTKNKKSIISRIYTIDLWSNYLQRNYSKKNKRIISYHTFYQIYKLTTENSETRNEIIKKFGGNLLSIKHKAAKAFISSFNLCNKGAYFRFLLLLLKY